MVFPTGKGVPEAGLQLAVTEPSTMSVPVTSGQLTTAVPPGLEADPGGGAVGCVSAGGVVSCTVTVASPCTGTPPLSTPSQLTVVAPSEKAVVTVKVPLPLPVGEQVTLIGALVVGSIALTWNVADAPEALVASTVTSSILIAGGAPGVVEAPKLASNATATVVRSSRSTRVRARVR